MFENELEKILRANGASLVGFCDLGAAASPEFPGLHFAVTIARKLSGAVIGTIKGCPSMIYFQHYRITNTKLDLLALDAVAYIENKGYNALPIAASQSTADDKESFRGVFPHKTGAVLSGIGFIGKSGLLITPDFGSAVRLATILTDMPLVSSRPVIENGCGSCELCKSACPAGAITGNTYVNGAARDTIFNAEKCSEHMKTYRNIGRGAVCGICISVCPYTKKSQTGQTEEQ